MEFFRRCCTEWSHFRYVVPALLVFEAVASAAIVLRIPYTKIDWDAYMSEVSGWWVHGTHDYALLKGDTGPLVYPAGFLYVYAALRSAASWVAAMAMGPEAAAAIVRDGNVDALALTPTAVRTAQVLFIGIYLVTQATVLKIYERAQVGWPIGVVALVLSKRIHSIYMLRLFNDGVAMCIAYASILILTRARSRWQWLVACIVFSAAVSVKMNVLLMAPGLLFLLLRNVGVLYTVACLIAMVGVQAVLGAPFLTTFPASYLSKAFELSRVFEYKWTVNWKFLPQHVFVSKTTAVVLLGFHVALLLGLGAFKWCRTSGGLLAVLLRIGLLPSSCERVRPRAAPGTSPGAAPDAATDTALATPSHDGHDGGQALRSVRSASVASGAGGAYVDSPAFIVWVMFTSNVVGILASRTLHYQFYSWYFHMLPFLFMCLPRRTSLPLYVLALVSVELGFNLCNAEGTSTPQSSAILQAGHALVLYAIFAAPTPVRAALHPRSAAPKHKAA